MEKEELEKIRKAGDIAKQIKKELFKVLQQKFHFG